MTQARRSRNYGTLREFHERKILTERIRHADDRILAEKYSRLLVEAFDEADLNKTKEVLDKLSKVKAACDKDPALKDVIGAAIEEAAKEVKDFTGGGINSLMKQGLGAVAKKFGINLDENPIVKTLTFLSALEDGFEKLPKVINTLFEKDYDPKQTIKEQLQDVDVKKFVDAIQTAFSPQGIFAKIKSLFGKGIPYVSDAKKFAEALMNAKGESLNELMGVLKAGPSARKTGAEVAQDAAEAQKDAGGVASVPQTPTTGQDLAKVVAAASAEKPGGEELQAQAAKAPQKVIDKFVDFVAKKSNVDGEKVKKVIEFLVKNKKIKTNLEENSSVKSRGKVVISASYVKRARMLYVESGCSSRKWARLLVEDVNDDLAAQLTRHIDDSNLRGDEQTALREVAKKFMEQFKAKSINSDTCVALLKPAELSEMLLSTVIDYSFAYSSSMEDVKKISAAGNKQEKKGDYQKIFKLLMEENPSANESFQDILKAYSGSSDSGKLAAEKIIEHLNKDGGDEPNVSNKVMKSVPEWAKQIEDVTPREVISVLDAIPEFLKIEGVD